MRHQSRKIKTWLAAAFSIAVLGVSVQGCISVRRNYEKAFDRGSVEAMGNGSTTKHELLNAFGPPIAIIEGKAFLAPIDLPEAIGFNDAQTTLASRNTITPQTRIYYYFYFTRRGIGTVPPLIYGEWDSMHNLWVLVNEERGLVEDYLYVKVDARDELKRKSKRELKEFRKKLEEYEKSKREKQNDAGYSAEESP